MKEKIKNSVLMLILTIVIYGLYSCNKSDAYRDPVSTDKTKPGIVTNVSVKNYNGASVITYNLPDNPNLLYVEADYSVGTGMTRQTKVSYFLDTIRLDGFQKSQQYTVTLRAVSRANVQSDPITVIVHPDTPYYEIIRKSLKISADYGGVQISASNAAKNAISINLVTIDPITNKFVIANQHYTSTDNIEYSVRGYKPNPAKFGVYVSDRFGNVSDTLVATLTPLYEEQCDKSKFFNYPFSSDAYIGYGGVVPNIFDGNTTEDNGANAWQTTIGPTSTLMQCTFGIGPTYKLTHFIMYMRGYGANNPKDFTIYGSNVDSPQDAVTPGGVPPGTTSGDWVALGTYRVPDPPSGMPQGQTTTADQVYVNNGVDFSIPAGSPPAKYIRIVVADTWFGLNYTIIREITFYGSPQ